MNRLKNTRKKWIIVIISLIIIILITLFHLLFDVNSIVSLLVIFFESYLSIIENTTAFILNIFDINVHFQAHKIILSDFPDYQSNYSELFNYWPRHLLLTYWTTAILFVFWIIPSSTKKKLLNTLILFVGHFIGVVSSLITLCTVGPNLSQNVAVDFPPTAFGFYLYSVVLIFWVRNNLSEIEKILSKFNIHIKFTSNTIKESFIILFLLLILKTIIIPFFEFRVYINFLLTTTQRVLGFFGHGSYQDGIYLIGTSGTLAMAKWCLGFITMYIFSAVIYLTGNKDRRMWIYIILGLILLNLLNIIRLTILFIFIQKNTAESLFIDHHDLFNIIVYLFIFLLWVIWFEVFSLKKNKYPS